MFKKVRQTLDKATNEETGSKSSSRILMFIGAGLIGLVWLGVLVGIAFFGWEWAAFAGALDWAKNFLFITVLPYISNKFSNGIASLRKGNNES